jgi:hypothetical protein
MWIQMYACAEGLGLLGGKRIVGVNLDVPYLVALGAERPIALRGRYVSVRPDGMTCL